MKDKTTAGLLAFFLGGAGIHRFYLNQAGLGILYIALSLITCGIFAAIVPFIDAIVFFIMNPAEFDRKYNPEKFRQQQVHVHVHNTPANQVPVIKQEVRQARPAVKPVSPPITRKAANNPHKITGVTKFKQYDFKGAKESFKKALAIHYDDIATHFNLGCCYSMEENIEKSMFHLSKAVELGFQDFKRIDNHDSLAYLRSHDEFLDFAKNNYRYEVEKETPTEKLETPPVDLLAEDDEVLDINRAEREKVILTEDIPKEKTWANSRDIFDDIFGGDDDAPSAAPTPIEKKEAIPSSLVEKLKQLGELRDKGILTDEEFNEQKKRLLS
jgi:TM2 domain-containing membrane protein YozV